MGEFSDWLKISQKTPPVGHLLREKFPNCWFRVHNLPSAKRYPDSDQEIAEIKNRNLIVAKKS